MRQPKHYPTYGKKGCCPHSWDNTPNLTGHFETDASIIRCKNPDAASKLTNYLVTDVAYGRNTGYSRSSLD